MRRWIAGGLLLGLLAAACGTEVDGTGGVGRDTAGPIKIGVVGPMTGLAAFLGKNMVEGVQLAVDDLNEAGGVLGRRIEFVVRDDENDPSRTGTAVRELIERENVVALFGPVGESPTLAVRRIIEENQIPTWAIAAGPELSRNVSPYIFRGYLPDEIQIEALVEYAAERYSRVALVAGNEADGEDFRGVAKAALEQRGTQVVAEGAYSQDETDHSAMVLSLKQANPDVVITGSQLGLFASRTAVAMRNLGLDAQLLGPGGLINYTYPDLARDAADGTIFVSFRSWGHLPREEWPESVRTFYERYVERYLPDGELSATGAFRAYSTNFLTYDMVNVWAAAVEQAGSAEPTAVADTLNAGFEFPAERSVIAVPWRYTADDHDGVVPDDLAFYRWSLKDDGKFELEWMGTVDEVLGR